MQEVKAFSSLLVSVPGKAIQFCVKNALTRAKKLLPLRPREEGCPSGSISTFRAALNGTVEKKQRFSTIIFL